MKTPITVLILLAILLSAPAQAEIVKSAIPCKTDTCLYWWPQAPVPAGWHQDREASDANGINILIPDTTTFATAKTVIYGKALYKPLVPTLTSLAQLIEKDRLYFLTLDAKLLITDAVPLPSGDGRLFKAYSFTPGGDTNWEEVAYGEEGDFYLIFTVSSQSRSDLAQALAAFRQFVGGYRENP